MGLAACSPEPDPKPNPMERSVTMDYVGGGAEGADPTRSRIVIVGARGVGKRALVKRLICLDDDGSNRAWDLESDCHKWTIDTKYYSVDVDVAVARTDDGHVTKDGEAVLPWNCEALVMVFDLSKPATFTSVQAWAATIDLQRFEILLCIGNKADQVQANNTEAPADGDGCASGSGNLQAQSLTSSVNEVASYDSRLPSMLTTNTTTIRSEASGYGMSMYLDWCSSNYIEYIEACAVDEVFDKGITLDGFGQGVARIRNALSAHMWPGMRMKSHPGQQESEMAAAALSDLTTEDQQLAAKEGEHACSDDDNWKSHPHQLLSSAREPESWLQQEARDDDPLDHQSGVSAASGLASGFQRAASWMQKGDSSMNCLAPCSSEAVSNVNPSVSCPPSSIGAKDKQIGAEVACGGINPWGLSIGGNEEASGLYNWKAFDDSERLEQRTQTSEHERKDAQQGAFESSPATTSNDRGSVSSPPPPPPPPSGSDRRMLRSDDVISDVLSNGNHTAGVNAGVRPVQTGSTRNTERIEVPEEPGREHEPMDDLERLLADMAMVRERGQGMPDRQRRELAASMAMRMVQMLASDDDDDDDKDDF